MKRVITIGREFGSGGRELGRRLAENLGMDYYDHEILTEISKHTSFSEEYVRSVVENEPHALYPITIAHSFGLMPNMQLEQANAVFAAQCQTITEMADKSDCIIVGRCADYILRERNPYRIFVYADMDSRIDRCRARDTQNQGLSRREIQREISKIDKSRARYYEMYADAQWGNKASYDLCINTAGKSLKELAAAVGALYRTLYL